MDYRAENNHSPHYALLHALPKIDLHRHLEGSLRLATLAEVANLHELDLAGLSTPVLRPHVQIAAGETQDPDTFLAKFKTLRQFYRSLEIIERVAFEAVADCAAENITYLELRFTPVALAREMSFPLEQVTDAVIQSARLAAKAHQIDVRLIVSMNRNEGPELGERVLGIAVDRLAEGIVGLDLAGAEHKFSGEPFIPIFEKARAAGLGVTIHAGEWAGPESIREAVEALGAARLGHGVRITEDPALLERLRAQGATFEVCLTSNVQSGVVAQFAEHPLKAMYKAGLQTTINTDDPSISGINLTDEYVLAVEHLGFTIEDIKRHIVNAAEAAFLPDEERVMLVWGIRQALDPLTPDSIPG